MSKKFTKRIEDFICENCGANVLGDGFTNHCPSCLYSKHVDVFPGDRKSDCLGLMRLIKVEVEKGEQILTHKCVKCGYEKRNKMSKNDDFDTVIRIVSQSQ